MSSVTVAAGTLNTGLSTTVGPTGLGGITAGQPALGSEFSSLYTSMQNLQALAGVLGSVGWVVTEDLADAAVSAAKFRSSAALSVVGNATNASASVSDIAAGTDGYVLRRSGTTLGFGTVAAAGLASGSVTTAKFGTIPACRLYKQATSAIADSTEVTINFSGTGDEVFDTAGMHSPTSNPSRITVGTAGIYLVQGGINWPYDAGGGRRVVYLNKNGSQIASASEMQVSTSSSNTFQNLSTIVDAAVGDYFEISVIQGSGGSMTIAGAGFGGPVLSAIWLAPAP